MQVFDSAGDQTAANRRCERARNLQEKGAESAAGAAVRGGDEFGEKSVPARSAPSLPGDGSSTPIPVLRIEQISRNPGVGIGIGVAIGVDVEMSAGIDLDSDSDSDLDPDGYKPVTHIHPLHPYTRGLLRSMPANPGGRSAGPEMRFFAIGGSPPDMNHLPKGCRFAPRCPERTDVCDVEFFHSLCARVPGTERNPHRHCDTKGRRIANGSRSNRFTHLMIIAADEMIPSFRRLAAARNYDTSI